MTRPVPEQPPGSPAPCQGSRCPGTAAFCLARRVTDGRTDRAQLGHSCCAPRAAFWARPEPGGERPRRRTAAPAGSPVGAPRALGAGDSSGFAWQRPGPAELPPHRRPHREDRGLRALALQVQSKAGWREEGAGAARCDRVVPPRTPTLAQTRLTLPPTLTHTSRLPSGVGAPLRLLGCRGFRPPCEGPLVPPGVLRHPPTRWGDTAWAGPDAPLCQARDPAGSCQHSLGLPTRPLVSVVLQFAHNSCRAGIAELGAQRGSGGGAEG